MEYFVYSQGEIFQAINHSTSNAPISFTLRSSKVLIKVSYNTVSGLNTIYCSRQFSTA